MRILRQNLKIGALAPFHKSHSNIHHPVIEIVPVYSTHCVDKQDARLMIKNSLSSDSQLILRLEDEGNDTYRSCASFLYLQWTVLD
jgi:hypothetical protein